MGCSDRSPTVSICTPVYNCENTLAITVRSILLQNFTDWELLIIDDGSSDKTVEVARSLSDSRIRVMADGLHRGIAYRRNQGIEMSRGKYFALMDGDDVCYPERFERQVQYLEKNPGIDLLGAGILVFRGSGTVLGTRRVPLSHDHICRRPWAGFHFSQPTWIGKHEWFRTHRYRSELARTEDQDLLLRTYRTSRFAALSDILVGYREESISLRKNFITRYSFCQSLVREGFEHREVLAAARGVIGQSLKGLADILAVATGLGYRGLRHRALPVDRDTELQWKRVWGKVQAPPDNALFSGVENSLLVPN
jgi:glycosyltransferase involved in cell wall biosynthesis